MSEVIGDTSHLHTSRVPFNAVHSVRGAQGHGSFRLDAATGFAVHLQSRASVRIVEDSLQCRIVGPASAEKAVVAHIAAIPSTCTDLPTSAAEVMTIGGSAFVEHSLYSGCRSDNLSFPAEVNHQIKPVPLVGSLPVIVYFFEVPGGDQTTTSIIQIKGSLQVDGIGFVKPW